MGFTFKAKAKSKSGCSDNWGMGLLLILFPADDNNCNNKNTSNIEQNNDNNIFASSSSQSPSFNSIRSIRRTSSSLLFTKAQSTISICALLVFLTLLLFTLSTFEPTVPTPTAVKPSRRFLSQKSPSSRSPPLLSFLGMWDNAQSSYRNRRANEASSIALQGMGTLYRRGTRAMSDLVVAHVAEDVKDDEFRLFLRLLHRSSLCARADIAFLLSSSSSSLSNFGSAIKEENESFLKLVQHYKELNGTRKHKNWALSFDLSHFVKSGKKVMVEPLWGKRIRGNYSNSSVEDGGQPTELTRLDYGSIVGFEVNELDPENSLSGFLDHVPMSLRRWACYPMLLGRVRRNFKHVALIDVKNLLVVGDPLGRVRSHSPESVHISMKQDKHTKRNSDKTQSHHQVNSAIIMGGTRGVRRLSNAMLTEIVRAAMQHRKKNSVTESGTLSQLVNNEHILKNINLITSTESITDASSLIGSNNNPNGGINIMQRGSSSRNGDVDSIIMKQICSCEADSSSVYRKC